MRTAFNKLKSLDLKNTKVKMRSLWVIGGGMTILLCILLGTMHHESTTTVQFTVLQKQQHAAILSELNDISATTARYFPR